MGLKTKGFSLIEMSIALLIIGIVSIPIAQRYIVYKADQIKGKTDSSKLAIDSALGDFFLANGRYPCVADISLGPGDAGYGLEMSPCTTTNPNSCDTGVCRATGAGGREVIIGGVPFQTLKLPMDSTLDGHKNKFTYAITIVLTSTATFNPANGAIINAEADLRTPPGVLTTATDTAPYHYALISHGADGRGAYTAEGVLRQTCTGQGFDLENCDNDATLTNGDTFYTAGAGFREAFQEIRLAPGDTHFDDFVVIDREVPINMWEYSTTNPEDIFTNFITGVGLDQPGVVLNRTGAVVNGPAGTPAYNTTITLDVEGDVRATRIDGDRMCGRDGDRGSSRGCFFPSDIMGPGLINCASVTNGVVKSLANRSLNCAATYLPINQICPAAQYLKGFDASGNAVCAPKT